jgi:hypothetical protein
LRDLTRTRTAVTRERTREIQRLEKLLEDAGIKLSSVASDLTGVSGRAMLEALIAGQSDPAAMAELAQKRMRAKIPQLTEALHGRFTSQHAFLTRMHLDLIDQHTAAIEQLTDRIEVVIEPFRSFRDLICTIPGIGGRTADIIVAETGADMTRFPTAQHLASWAGAEPTPFGRTRGQRFSASRCGGHVSSTGQSAIKSLTTTGQPTRKLLTGGIHRDLVDAPCAVISEPQSRGSHAETGIRVEGLRGGRRRGAWAGSSGRGAHR